MKTRGFTLIELLAVIVILAIIALIATPIILGIIANTRSEARVRSAEAVEHAVETGYLTTYMKCAADGSGLDTCITVAKVIENTKVENEVKDSRTANSITTKDGVVCTLDSSFVLTCVYGEENVITPKTVNGQSNSGTSVPTSPICEFTGYYITTGGEETDKEEYTCHLDTDRTFYVLGDNAEDSTKVDLIMDRNYTDANVPVAMKWCDPAGDNPYDNACMESFFSSFKREEYNSKEYEYFDDLKNSVDEYMRYYNEYRPHQSLKNKTPNIVEDEYYSQIDNKKITIINH